METMLIGCALTTLAWFETATNAEARPRERSRVYLSGYSSFGALIYVERYMVGYDRYGYPIWEKRVIRRGTIRAIGPATMSHALRPSITTRGLTIGHARTTAGPA